MADAAFCSVVHRSTFLIAGDDPGADAGLTCAGVIHIIIRHVVIPDIFLVHGDVAEVHGGVVPCNFIGQIDGRHTGAAFQDAQRGICFLLSLNNLVLNGIQ